jgi:outer membrane protein OmpA-like peptidoglycan-associated protein/tetratricopeptide (TPR) repeat protein
MHKKHLFSAFFICFFSIANAQSTEKLLKKAGEYMETQRYHLAVTIYQDILKFQPNQKEANLGLGLCYLQVHHKRKAYQYLEKAYFQDKKIPNIEAYLARAYQLADKLDSAIILYQKVISQTDQWKEKDTYNYLSKKLQECEIAQKLMASPVNAKIQNFGSVVNSKYHDYCPVFSFDEKKMVFTSRRKGSSNDNVTEDGDYFEDIYISYFENGAWKEPINLGKNVNTLGHDAAVSISADGNQIFIYRDENGGDLYVTNNNNQEWSQPLPFSKKINTKYNESSLSMTADGQTIYFTSDKPGGYGGKDIYVSTLDKSGNWQTPTNLGPSVNTAFDDDAPFIHPDGVTLYFSSRGHQSMGGYDIFKTELTAGKWQKPENLGYPINSTDDDIYFTISRDNKRGYFSSLKEEGLGETDIYTISMPDKSDFKPFQKLEPSPFNQKKPFFAPPLEVKSNVYPQTPFTILRLKIVDEVSNQPIVTALQIIDLFTGFPIFEKTTSETGNEEISITSGKNYGLRLEKQGYLFYSDVLELPYSSDYQLLLKDIYMKKIQVGSKVVLRNIFFDYNKSSLQPVSETELDKLYELLNENKLLKVEISGHTDNVGSAEANKKLSTARAKSVVDYLILKGVSPTRLKYMGYGKERPVADNESEMGRQLNRRTEFEIIGN